MNYANHDKTELQHFYVYFFTYIKISKDLSARYYQNNKKRLQNKLVKDIKVFLKKKNNIMVENNKKNQKKKKKKAC